MVSESLSVPLACHSLILICSIPLFRTRPLKQAPAKVIRGLTNRRTRRRIWTPQQARNASPHKRL